MRVSRAQDHEQTRVSLTVANIHALVVGPGGVRIGSTRYSAPEHRLLAAFGATADAGVNGDGRAFFACTEAGQRAGPEKGGARERDTQAVRGRARARAREPDTRADTMEVKPRVRACVPATRSPSRAWKARAEVPHPCTRTRRTRVSIGRDPRPPPTPAGRPARATHRSTSR